ncbi:type VI secretion system-associated protein TagF [Paracoccus pacificus]|uniref:Type VI secretion system-associated protein TagF n=1 Tax=Paracoccus pacificus TaxID=1463598 RepID=A0ABW4R7Z6_9RHOB
MSAEPELTPKPPQAADMAQAGAAPLAGAGLYGKHPGYGDFLAAGLVRSAEEVLIPWLTQTLGQMREALGDGWAGVFDNAPPLRFWIGSGVAGPSGLRGALRPSRDSVGRRFPLMLVAPCPDGHPPVLSPDAAFFDAAEAQLAALSEGPMPPARDVVAGFGAAETQGAGESASFWAVNDTMPSDALLPSLVAAELRAAASRRSYWWVDGGEGRGRPSVMLAGPAMPDADALIWIMGGQRGAGVAADSASPFDEG